jgi:pyrrolidone-carboxylate peptidase
VTADPRHILLTGFDPFDGDAVNPSGEVASSSTAA